MSGKDKQRAYRQRESLARQQLVQLQTDYWIEVVRGLFEKNLGRDFILAETGMPREKITQIVHYLEGKAPKPVFRYMTGIMKAATEEVMGIPKMPPLPRLGATHVRCSGCGGKVVTGYPCYLCGIRKLKAQEKGTQYAA